MKLYKCLIRPRLEYAVHAWRPYLQKDIDLIEGVQRRATKLVVETKGMSYDERLKFLDMTTPGNKESKRDLIEVFKIMKGFENVNMDKFFLLWIQGVRGGHELKLFQPSCRLDCRKICFFESNY
jgi:hypothetical protein